ncbi:rhodanese-like domain-containing protein [Deferrisoma sp.]
MQKLQKLGFTNAFHLDGGWLAWKRAGYPVEPLPSSWSDEGAGRR